MARIKTEKRFYSKAKFQIQKIHSTQSRTKQKQNKICHKNKNRFQNPKGKIGHRLTVLNLNGHSKKPVGKNRVHKQNKEKQKKTQYKKGWEKQKGRANKTQQR